MENQVLAALLVIIFFFIFDHEFIYVPSHLYHFNFVQFQDWILQLITWLIILLCRIIRDTELKLRNHLVILYNHG
jgi:hypothetical protein